MTKRILTGGENYLSPRLRCDRFTSDLGPKRLADVGRARYQPAMRALAWLDAHRACSPLGHRGHGGWALATELASRGFALPGLRGPRAAALAIAPAQAPAAHLLDLETTSGPFGGLYFELDALAFDPQELPQVAIGGPVCLRLTHAAARPLSTLVAQLRSDFELASIAVDGQTLAMQLNRSASPGGGWAEAALLELSEQLASGAAVGEAEARAALNAEVAASARRVSEEARRRQRDVGQLRAELARRRTELAEIRRSTRYRLAHALVLAARPGRDTLRLPRRVLNLVRDRNRPLAERFETSGVRAHLTRDLERFAAHVREIGADTAVFMLSGTTYVQPLRANRPIRLTRVLRERGVPVLFSFHGKLSSPDLPNNEDPGLTQIPIELTETVIDRIAEMDLGKARKVLIVSYPHPCVASTLGRFAVRGWATVYDCRDDWEAFAKVGAAEWYDPALERFVVAQCDRSFAVSWPLRDKIRAFAPTRRIDTSPNAYDPAFLSPNYHRSPSDQVVVGYFGHLTAKWFDWPGLARVAGLRPEWRFEIIGHQAPENTGTPDNVVLLGPKTHPEICEIAAKWRVGIIPFKISVLADAVDPIKIYEYFGLGLPVVSFRMPQIDTYPETETVSSVDAFAEALDRAVARTVDARSLQSFLDRNTWAHRVDQLMSAALAALEEPPFEKYLEAAP